MVTPLLSNLVLIQNRLLGLYYTALHGYCDEFGFPSPPPPMDDVVATWKEAFGPIRSQTESISFIARGTAVRQPMSAGNGLPQNPTAPANGVRRTATGLISYAPQARTLRTPSMPLPADARTSPTPSFKRLENGHATDFTTATILGGSAVTRSTNSSSSTLGQQGYSPAAAASMAGLAKKKPPPPPPPKRKPDEWVVALYPFVGEAGNGDLSFQEGDRIRVVKRTGTDQDWYVSLSILFFCDSPLWKLTRLCFFVQVGGRAGWCHGQLSGQLLQATVKVSLSLSLFFG